MIYLYIDLIILIFPDLMILYYLRVMKFTDKNFIYTFTPYYVKNNLYVLIHAA